MKCWTKSLAWGRWSRLLQDPTVNDILVNTADSVYVERGGVLEKTNVVFKDNIHLMHIIDKIVSSVGRRVDESSPMVDARLADGSRVNVIIPPLAVDGPISPFAVLVPLRLTADDLLAYREYTPQMLDILAEGGESAAEHHHLRRHRRRQNHPAQRAVRIYFRAGTHCHYRRFRRTATEAATRGAPGVPSAERGRQRRRPPDASW